MTEYREINDDYCPICLRSSNDDDKPDMIYDGEQNCGNPVSVCPHYFCLDCIHQMTDPRCPLCRLPTSLIERNNELTEDTDGLAGDEDNEQINHLHNVIRLSVEYENPPDIAHDVIAEQIHAYTENFNSDPQFSYNHLLAITPTDIRYTNDYRDFIGDIIAEAVACAQVEMAEHPVTNYRRTYIRNAITAIANRNVIRAIQDLNKATAELELHIHNMRYRQRYVPIMTHPDYERYISYELLADDDYYRDSGEDYQDWNNWIVVSLGIKV